jgi:hypothetical protein
MTVQSPPKKYPFGLFIGCIAIFCIVFVLALAAGGVAFYVRSRTAFFPPPPSTQPSVSITTPTLEAIATDAVPTLPLIPTEAASPSTDASTPRATLSPAPAIAPGVYVTAIRTNPSPPVRRQDVSFIVRFVNATNLPAAYRAVVYIYRPDQSNSFGETPALGFSAPRGTSEVEIGVWRLTGPGGCENFIVRVGWLDDIKHITLFTRTDGKIFEQPITVCP